MDGVADGEAEELSGSSLAWVKETACKRNAFNIPDRRIKPFTSRAGVHARGLPRQTKQPNFQDELLDIRVAEHAHRHGKPLDCQLPFDFWTDMRQSAYRNLTDGRFNLVGNSRAFNHFLDRSLCAKEYGYQMGWGSHMRLSDVHKPLTELEQAGLSFADPRKMNKKAKPKVVCRKRKVVSPVKRKRKPKASRAVSAALSSTSRQTKDRPQAFCPKAVEMFGNGMALPDLALVWYCSWLTTPGLFANGPDFGHKQWRQTALSKKFFLDVRSESDCDKVKKETANLQSFAKDDELADEIDLRRSRHRAASSSRSLPASEDASVDSGSTH